MLMEMVPHSSRPRGQTILGNQIIPSSTDYKLSGWSFPCRPWVVIVLTSIRLNTTSLNGYRAVGNIRSRRFPCVRGQPHRLPVRCGPVPLKRMGRSTRQMDTCYTIRYAGYTRQLDSTDGYCFPLEVEWLIWRKIPSHLRRLGRAPKA